MTIRAQSRCLESSLLLDIGKVHHDVLIVNDSILSIIAFLRRSDCLKDIKKALSYAASGLAVRVSGIP